MSQVEVVGRLDESVGYLLKQAASALRGAMDAELRALELSVPQYSCLELLHQREELSNAELARGAFVTRQSMNLVLRGLEKRGLLTRPTTAATGRARPAELTEAGRELHHQASVLVRAVEQQMLSALTAAQEDSLRSGLHECITGLADPDANGPGGPSL
ncbi:MarR family transcriptional regulator [Antribacter sp. KLBMP9083]|uniref:MarR family transcriptional regulator n=1 Tax=Antribacter soli TaxID=2910976 RepID=A0AA41QDK8_9MICO|nr:MarR family transcriptional regulator [Antribacter soli]MCF4121504.1 MarR family transcriptional regulator [Antribacter soli]